jgi:DNA replication protein DnaC
VIRAEILILDAIAIRNMEKKWDRVLHHAITGNIRGNSYRLKDKLKAGLTQAAEAVN